MTTKPKTVPSTTTTSKTPVAKASSEKTEKIPVKDIATWRKVLAEKAKQLLATAKKKKIASSYDQLVYIVFDPVLPANKTELKRLTQVLATIPYCEDLSVLINRIYEYETFTLKLEDLVTQHLSRSNISDTESIGIDWLIATTGVLQVMSNKSATSKKFIASLNDDLADIQNVSPLRVQASMISAGQNVIIAGRDVNFIQDNYRGDVVALRSYLSKVRTEWNIPATNIHPRADNSATHMLHELFTPPDVWLETTEQARVEMNTLSEYRFEAIEKDLVSSRRPLLEVVAENPYLVITGGAGTGKSSLCHFIVTALGYACDPKAEKSESVSGLNLLGPAWIHHAFLPVYVSLRDFVTHAEDFPKTIKDAKAETLLSFIKKRSGKFGDYLEAFLTQTNVDTHGTLLVLDGLDEVYSEKNRVILRHIVENWSQRFKSSRILMTSRTYAYHPDADWRLSAKFKSYALAPFTWRQIQSYIACWYQIAAQTRPGSFGGEAIASQQARIIARDLIKGITENKTIWPLARQPLLLALLTLIHEDYKHLPDKRAELYENTVDLLDRWNIPSPVDTLHEKLAGLNLERMRAALKHIAFDLQSQQKSGEKYPTAIQRSQLLDKLMAQQLYGDGLGAKIEDVLEYLATRNGIIVSDKLKHYRFPHLSIQEYLAACALIEFYDECEMPEHLQPPSVDGWTFPDNIVALMGDEPFRWRQVLLFAGSIIAADKGQDLRWRLIEQLLPDNLGEAISESELHGIAISAEIWVESWLKPRTRSQKVIYQHLKKCLQAIENDERLDAPERMTTIEVLAKLSIDQFL